MEVDGPVAKCDGGRVFLLLVFFFEITFEDGVECPLFWIVVRFFFSFPPCFKRFTGSDPLGHPVEYIRVREGVISTCKYCGLRYTRSSHGKHHHWAGAYRWWEKSWLCMREVRYRCDHFYSFFFPWFVCVRFILCSCSISLDVVCPVSSWFWCEFLQLVGREDTLGFLLVFLPGLMSCMGFCFGKKNGRGFRMKSYLNCYLFMLI